ncbi:MAG: AAA family ATPase [Candidatus Aureabacteria bacterium]|nr:AAA family ATPase [Candidatus Auribacterota bacterium]
MTETDNDRPNHYFGKWGLVKDPFTTSPDPDYLFPSHQHLTVLTCLEISVRLRRGACVVLGEIGTGKTTLCRTLIQKLESDPSIEIALLLNPPDGGGNSFLSALSSLYRLPVQTVGETFSALKDYLFYHGVERNKTVVLMIDEAQKLNTESIELIRTLLNYETNEYKLLQLVLFAQLELKDKIKQLPNFEDRLNIKIELNPLSVEECGELIQFRLLKAGYGNEEPVFTDDAIRAIHEITGGYPRKICMLAHKAMMEMVMTEVMIAGESLIRQIGVHEVVLA